MGLAYVCYAGLVSDAYTRAKNKEIFYDTKYIDQCCPKSTGIIMRWRYGCIVERQCELALNVCPSGQLCGEVGNSRLSEVLLTDSCMA